MKKDNITLIGMPTSGKSLLGKILAKKLGFEFIDSDDYIEEKEKMTLQEIINKKGDKEFLKIEEKRNLELLSRKNCVFAPGGSVVYSKNLMETFKNFSILIFLDTPIEIIEKRILEHRGGIVWLKAKSIKQLYDKRVPLYKKYADITISCLEKSNKEIVNEIIKKLNFLEIAK